jgi:AP2-associated kinase
MDTSLVASKRVVLKKMFAGSPDLVKQLSVEVTLMKELSGHPNIVRVLGSETRRQGEGAEILVLMEMCPGGHLLNRINVLKEGKRTLPMVKILEVFLQIVGPVAHMHSFEPPVTHRDLKVRTALPASALGCHPPAHPPPHLHLPPPPPPPHTLSLRTC